MAATPPPTAAISPTGAPVVGSCGAAAADVVVGAATRLSPMNCSGERSESTWTSPVASASAQPAGGVTSTLYSPVGTSAMWKAPVASLVPVAVTVASRVLVSLIVASATPGAVAGAPPATS